jgi:phytoene dehydrogenase-like protein
MHKVQIVGGGIAGLVAAIECAERGAGVTLFEATAKLGGRARSFERDGYVTNLGPHALYSDGSAWAWLEERDLLPATVGPKITGFRFLHGGKLKRLPWPLIRALRGLREPAPDGADFRSWAEEEVGREPARAAIGYLTLPLFDADPGRLSAQFAQEILARTSRRGVVRYVVGGWGVLVDRIASRARALGVRIETGIRVTELEGSPTIVATGPGAAAKLLQDESLRPPPRQVALLDLGLPARRRPAAVLDLDEGTYLVRHSASDRSVAPPGHELVQCSAPIRPDEEAAGARARVERVLDQAFSGWRSDAAFVRRTAVAAPAVADLPGTSWEDRPPVAYRDGVFLAGDYVAAPGLLSEISYMSARRAAAGAVEAPPQPSSAMRTAS